MNETGLVSEVEMTGKDLITQIWEKSIENEPVAEEESTENVTIAKDEMTEIELNSEQEKTQTDPAA